MKLPGPDEPINWTAVIALVRRYRGIFHPEVAQVIDRCAECDAIVFCDECPEDLYCGNDGHFPDCPTLQEEQTNGTTNVAEPERTSNGARTPERGG